MGTLVDDLLGFSRIGRTETQKTTVNLSQILKSVIGEFAPDTQGRKIIWHIGDLPKCYGDPAMLRLVFTNLVSNALKFTRTREPAEIEIDTLNHSPTEVVVFVKDNGVGFDIGTRISCLASFSACIHKRHSTGPGSARHRAANCSSTRRQGLAGELG